MLLDHPSDGPTAIRTQFGAIFVSLELSRSNWLITSLSPGKGEKMSKHSVTAGDVAGLMRLCEELKRKTEDRRRLCRERRTLIEERITHVNRIKGLLFAQGICDYAPLRHNRRTRFEALRTGDGRELPSHLRAQIDRELDRIELLLGQIKAVEAAQDALLAAARKPASEEAAPDPVTMLLALKGMGANFAAVLWSEAFYRQFANRRQVAAYAGLAATPWQSGGIRHEQGVSKAGNPRLRTTMIQLAWLWIRHQPQSALTRWFKERSQQGRKRAIVALARKLLVALWKYVTQGVVIEGAVMKPAA